MIRKLKLVNYRSHENTEVELEPLTVFIGPIGGGKSNLFRGLRRLKSVVERFPRELFEPGPRGFDAEIFAGVSNAASIGFEVEADGLEGFGDDQARYAVELAPGPDGAFIAHEKLDHLTATAADLRVFERDHTRTYGQQLPEFGSYYQHDEAVLMRARVTELGEVEELPDSEPMLFPDRSSANVRLGLAVADVLAGYGHWHLQPAGLKRDSQVFDSPRRLAYDGSGLPALLRSIRSDPELSGRFSAIEDEMREFFPKLNELRLPTVGEDRLGIAFVFSRWATAFTSADVSDGMLLTLGILTLLHQPNMPQVMALEEPEAGLHPSLLQWLVDKLWDAAHGHTGRPPVQILVSTHSPYFLDHFAETPEVVRVVDQVDGVSRVRSLPDVFAELGLGPDEMRKQPLGDQWYSGIFEGAPA
jgi:predicted ATPase